ncbi:MAG: chemotaxis-specific protein-glutamate methyltransferase CheB [Spirochaetota bacterium]|nr:chemotaxis-specific protein-glutamate methyltransferase CheB [Spirochaetota bacterium]
MRILLVDDSILMRSILKQLISSWEGFEIVGEEGNGKKAIESVIRLKPDLLLMDINMPVMDGIEATEIIMRISPLPIVILTSEDIAGTGFKAINNGALEIIPKPDIAKMNDPIFVEGFKNILTQVSRYGHFKIKSHGISSAKTLSNPFADMEDIVNSTRVKSQKYKIIVMGASTGGPSSVKTILSKLPKNFSLGILLCQHIEAGFDKGYAEWLNDGSELTIKVAAHGEKITSGTVLIAPATQHLICHNDQVLLDDGPRIENQKPSIDKMFISASKVYGNSVIGVLLTGMGNDGAQGCKSIVNSGGITLIQNEETSMIFGMPKAAIELNAASEILALDQFADSLKRKCKND